MPTTHWVLLSGNPYSHLLKLPLLDLRAHFLEHKRGIKLSSCILHRWKSYRRSVAARKARLQGDHFLKFQLLSQWGRGLQACPTFKNCAASWDPRSMQSEGKLPGQKTYQTQTTFLPLPLLQIWKEIIQRRNHLSVLTLTATSIRTSKTVHSLRMRIENSLDGL